MFCWCTLTALRSGSRKRFSKQPLAMSSQSTPYDSLYSSSCGKYGSVRQRAAVEQRWR